jgi:hypothetical protein
MGIGRVQQRGRGGSCHAVAMASSARQRIAGCLRGQEVFAGVLV